MTARTRHRLAEAAGSLAFLLVLAELGAACFIVAPALGGW